MTDEVSPINAGGPDSESGSHRRALRMPTREGVKRAFGLISPRRVSLLYVLIILVIIYGLWIPETFLTVTTLKSLAGEQAVTGMLVIGALFPLSTGQFDLSLGHQLGLAAIVSSWLMVDQGFDPVSAILITLAVGATIGMINGILVVRFKINSLIATLGMSSILQAAILAISDNKDIIGMPESFTRLSLGQPFGIPITFVYMVILAVIAWYILEHTPPGRRLYAAGRGPEAARLVGVPVGRLVLLSFVALGLIAAFAGLVVTAKIGAGSTTIGPRFLLPVYAAAFLGTTQFKPGRANVAGGILAVFVLAVGVKGLQLAGAEFWVDDLFNGLALVIAVGIASARKR